MSKRVYATSTILTWPFWKSKNVHQMSTILTQPFLISNAFPERLLYSHSLSWSQMRLWNVYHPHTALQEVKTHVLNIYFRHTAFPDVKTHLQKVYYPHKDFPEVKMRFYHPHTVIIKVKMCLSITIPPSPRSSACRNVCTILNEPFQTSKCVHKMSTIFTWRFWKSERAFWRSSILT